MRKFTFALIIGIGAIAAGAAAFPWYLGWQTEQCFKRALAAPQLASNALVSVGLVSYQRGWLHSEAVHRVTLRADPNVHFDVHHAIRHVPQKRLVEIDSTPRWPEKVQAAADYYFGSRPAINVHTTLRFDDTIEMNVESPAFSKPLLTQPDVNLAWGGASGTFSLADTSRIALALDVPRFAVQGAGTSFAWSGMHVSGDWNAAGSQLDWTGQTVLALAELTFGGPWGSGSLKGIETRAFQRNQGQTLLLGYLLQLREGSASSLAEGTQSFRDAVLEVELDRLDKKALAKYFDDLNSAERARVTPEAYKRLTGQLVFAAVRELLKASPEIRLKRVGVRTDSGTLAGSAMLGFNGEGFGAEVDGKANGAEAWLSRVRLNASAQLSGALLRDWMAKDARNRALEALGRNPGGTDEGKLRILAEELVQEQIAALEGAGLLKSQGDTFSMDAELKQGRLLINGVRRDQMLPAIVPPLLTGPENVESRV